MQIRRGLAQTSRGWKEHAYSTSMYGREGGGGGEPGVEQTRHGVDIFNKGR